MCEYCRPHPRQAFVYEEAWDENPPYIKSEASPNAIHKYTTRSHAQSDIGGPCRERIYDKHERLDCYIMCKYFGDFQIRDKAKIRFIFLFMSAL